MTQFARRLVSSRQVLLGLAVLVLGAALWTARSAQSEPTPRSRQEVDIAYLSVTGEGPSARAWFKDAPSTGLAVQDALDRFAKDGYHVKHVTEELRSTADAVAFVILLERMRDAAR